MCSVHIHPVQCTYAPWAVYIYTFCSVQLHIYPVHALLTDSSHFVFLLNSCMGPKVSIISVLIQPFNHT